MPGTASASIDSAAMFRGRSSFLFAGAPVALVLALSSCHLASARAYNLEQLHDPDGTARRVANLHGDLEHLLISGFERSNFGGEDFRRDLGKETRVADPHGKCLANVLALADCRRDERVAVTQAVTFAWLARDCTYVLSRERCVLEIGNVMADLGKGDTPIARPAEPATPAVVTPAIQALIEATRGFLAAPGLGSKALDEAAAALAALPLDRAGALRGARVTQVLLDGREGNPGLQPLRRLRVDLARRCAGQAVLEAREDLAGRVRAAALRVGVRLFPEHRGEWLWAALTERPEGVSDLAEWRLAAVELLARNGLPPADGGGAEHALADWNGALVDLLLRQNGGRVSLAVTRALARLNELPREPRPEVWVAWWRARVAAGGDSRPGEG